MGAEYDGSANPIAYFFVGNLKYAGFLNRAELQQRILDLARNDKDTFAFEAIIDTAEDRDITFVINGRKVVGQKPSVALGCFSLLSIAEIFEEKARIIFTESKPARCSPWLRREGIIEDCRLGAPRNANSAGLFGNAWPMTECHLGFRNSEMLPHRALEAALPFPANGGLQRLSGGIHASQRGKVKAIFNTGFTQNSAIKRCDAIEQSNTVSRDC